jgi:hypothetical protein
MHDVHGNIEVGSQCAQAGGRIAHSSARMRLGPCSSNRAQRSPLSAPAQTVELVANIEGVGINLFPTAP